MIHIACAQCCQDAQFLPMKGGISDTLSPKTIMSEETLDYKKQLNLKVAWTILSGA
jgi:hypothetical protein